MNTHQRALQIVRQVGEINFVGNVIPHSWYKHLTLPNGKPYIVAITILSEIVYWYRPLVLKDEATGRVLPVKKKFAEHKYRKSYGELAEQFGFSKRQVIDAIGYLKEQDVITTEVKKAAFVHGVLKGNVMYIEVVPERLQAISALPDEDAIEETPSTPGGIEPLPLEGYTLTLFTDRGSTPVHAEALPLDVVSLKGVKTPAENPPEIPTETPPQSEPGEAEGPLADPETIALLRSEGIVAITKYQDIPAAIVRAAFADTGLPEHHFSRPAFAALRLDKWRSGDWLPPSERVRPTPSPAPAPSSSGESPQPGGDGVWSAVLAQLAAQIPPGEFTTYVADSRLLLLDPELAVVGAPHVFARDKLQGYAALINATLGDVTGTVRPIEFVIGADP